MLGNDHVLAQKFRQIEIRLTNARPAAVLEFGFPILDAAAKERGEQQHKGGLGEDGNEVGHVRRNVNKVRDMERWSGGVWECCRATLQDCTAPFSALRVR